MARPGPVSTTASAAGSAWTVTEPPSGVIRSAFSIRFESTWSTRSGSATAGAGRRAFGGELDAEGACLRLEPLDRLVGQLGEVDAVGMDAEDVGVEAREVEQVADEPLEPLRLAQDHLRHPLGRHDTVARAPRRGR